jgi:hypothetical protein
MSSTVEFEGVEGVLEKYLPEAELKEVTRILYGKQLKYVYLLDSPVVGLIFSILLHIPFLRCHLFLVDIPVTIITFTVIVVITDR